jgi:hypothetical protein
MFLHKVDAKSVVKQVWSRQHQFADCIFEATEDTIPNSPLKMRDNFKDKLQSEALKESCRRLGSCHSVECHGQHGVLNHPDYEEAEEKTQSQKGALDIKKDAFKCSKPLEWN